jgi:hypothetical protein
MIENSPIGNECEASWSSIRVCHDHAIRYDPDTSKEFSNLFMGGVVREVADINLGSRPKFINERYVRSIVASREVEITY